MATIQAPVMRDAVYQGPQGNLSFAESQIVLAAAASGDVVELLEMPIGMRICSIDVVSEALGAGVTMEVKSGTDTLVAAASHADAIAKSVPMPFRLFHGDHQRSLLLHQLCLHHTFPA